MATARQLRLAAGVRLIAVRFGRAPTILVSSCIKVVTFLTEIVSANSGTGCTYREQISGRLPRQGEEYEERVVVAIVLAFAASFLTGTYRFRAGTVWRVSRDRDRREWRGHSRRDRDRDKQGNWWGPHHGHWCQRELSNSRSDAWTLQRARRIDRLPEGFRQRRPGAPRQDLHSQRATQGR